MDAEEVEQLEVDVLSVIHFLNVNEGECNIVQHDSGRVSVIDVCNGNAENETILEYANHRQKEHPVNPINYIASLGITSIFRFILTHPDMDHLDGIEKLFDEFSIINFWDTDNNKEMNESQEWGRYRKEDWEFYQSIRNSENSPKVLRYLSGNTGQYYNLNEDGTAGGDGLYILCPTKALVDTSNSSGDYNTLSYVILLKEKGKKIVFAGDSGSEAWDYILDQYEDDVRDIDLLIAPHHGRKTGGNDDYLDVLNPKLTLLGNAKSKHLDYNAWNSRGLEHITNNEANCVIVDVSSNGLTVYCTYEKFAKEMNSGAYYSSKHKAWYIGTC